MLSTSFLTHVNFQRSGSGLKRTTALIVPTVAHVNIKREKTEEKLTSLSIL